MDSKFYKKTLKELIGIRVSHINNVRCTACDSILYSDSAPAKLYNNILKCKCNNCKNGNFYDSKEKWISTVKPARPWTWFSGYWEKETQKKGE